MTKIQIVDEENEAKRPLVSNYQCNKCSATYEYRWKYCKLCRYAEAKINYRGKLYGQITTNDSEGCPGKHKLYTSAGPFAECFTCGSVYATWTNFEPRKYKWVDANRPE